MTGRSAQGSPTSPSAPPTVAPAGRWVAAGLTAGVVAMVVPTAIHGNPPIESAELTLRWIAERPSWRLVHLLIGALIVDFAVIVPATALAWLWALVLAGACWSGRLSPRPRWARAGRRPPRPG